MLNSAVGSDGLLEMKQAVDSNTRAELLWLIPLAGMFLLLVATAETLSYFNNTSAIAMIAGYGAKALRLLPLVASVGIICQLGVAVIRDARTA